MRRVPPTGGARSEARGVAPNVRTAVRRPRQGVAAADRDGFAGVEERIGNTVLKSERLVDATDRLAVPGLRPRGPESTSVPRDASHATASARWATVGALGMRYG